MSSHILYTLPPSRSVHWIVTVLYYLNCVTPIQIALRLQFGTQRVVLELGVVSQAASLLLRYLISAYSLACLQSVSSQYLIYRLSLSCLCRVVLLAVIYYVNRRFFSMRTSTIKAKFTGLSTNEPLGRGRGALFHNATIIDSLLTTDVFVTHLRCYWQTCYVSNGWHFPGVLRAVVILQAGKMIRMTL